MGYLAVLVVLEACKSNSYDLQLRMFLDSPIVDVVNPRNDEPLTLDGRLGTHLINDSGERLKAEPRQLLPVEI